MKLGSGHTSCRIPFPLPHALLHEVPMKRPPDSLRGPTPLDAHCQQPGPSCHHLTGCPPQPPRGSFSRAPTQTHDTGMGTIQTQESAVLLWLAFRMTFTLSLLWLPRSQHRLALGPLPGLPQQAPLSARAADFDQLFDQLLTVPMCCLNSESSHQLVPGHVSTHPLLTWPAPAQPPDPREMPLPSRPRWVCCLLPHAARLLPS